MQGILMTPDNHKAIRDKLKSQTRRLDHLKETNKEPSRWIYLEGSSLPKLGRFTFFYDNQKPYHGETATIVVKPRYRIGETVYIKEAFQYVTLAEVDPWKDRAIKDGSFRRKPNGSPVTMCYKLDGYEIGADWLNPRTMPAWAARTFIKIIDVRPERLQDITIGDAGAEIGWDYSLPIPDHLIDGHHFRFEFHKLWDSTNKAYPFDGNWWVWRICFNLIENKQ